MANIFALQGVASCGKSGTLIELLNLIVAKYPDAKVQSLHGRTIDVEVIVHPVNGMKIGIESRGDPCSRLQKSLAKFRAENCDIIFCACRTSGMTVRWIKAMSPPDNVRFIQQTLTQTGQKAANSAMAVHLMRLAGI